MAHVVMNMYVSIVKVRDHEDERVHPSGAAFEVEVQIARHDQAGMAVTIDGISDPELTRHALLPILQVRWAFSSLSSLTYRCATVNG